MYCMIISLYFLKFIYSHHCLLKLGIFLFPLLANFVVFFETYGFSYTTQTPCPSGGTTSSLFFNRFCHIEDNFQLGWGESWGRKFLLLMLSYFGNLVAFCLILNFFKFLFYSPSLLRKNFQNEMREIEFLFFSWLRVCIMLTKVDELLKLLLKSSLCLPL